MHTGKHRQSTTTTRTTRTVGKHRAPTPETPRFRLYQRVVAVLVAITFGVAVPGAAFASAVSPHRGEGIISITQRTCGSSASWKAQATRNHITAESGYLVRLGQKLDIVCPNATAAKVQTAAKTTTKSTAGYGKPLASLRVTSCAGWRWGALHRGIDFGVAQGTPIKAIAAGTVVGAGWIWRGYGIEVFIRHADGKVSHYAHQSREIVSVGQKVARGQTIGYVGSTGDSTGPHLHLEVLMSYRYGAQLVSSLAQWLRTHGTPTRC